MIVHPTAGLAETAKHFKCSMSYISIIRNSDAFKAYYRGRVDRQFDEVTTDILGQTQAMTAIALDRINHKLETIGDQLSVSELKDIADTGLKRLGFGAMKNSPGPQVNVNVGVVVDRGDLASARQRMAEVHGVATPVKQLTATEEATVVPEGSGG